MSTLRTLAIAAAFVGSASLALAQGGGMTPNPNPPQQPGASMSAPGSTQSAQIKKSKTSKKKLYNKAKTKKHRKIYNEALTPKKKMQSQKSQGKMQSQKSQGM